uniref:NUDIX domain protein n=1 Tax=Pithovirus LCPAC406 TaxID=2506599 RepID=A0A481ZGP9_9VIRU|nr:MAG: NUDIX domain protein [Pithovirus LCPAC406]
MSSRRVKRSAFVLLRCIDTEEILCVINNKGMIGLPGGKEEKQDRSSQFLNAKREFKEETGNRLPCKIKYKYIGWGEQWHDIRIYYADISLEIADSLKVGVVNDPDSSIKECQWLLVEVLLNKSDPKILYHIKIAFSQWKSRLSVKI